MAAEVDCLCEPVLPRFRQRQNVRSVFLASPIIRRFCLAKRVVT